MRLCTIPFFFFYFLSVYHINGNQHSNHTNGTLYKYKNLRRKVRLIKKNCGELCDTSHPSYVPISEDSKFYYVPIEKEVDCKRLWNNSIFDESSEFDAAIQIIPKYLRDHFSHNGMVDINYDYYDELKQNIWNETFNKWGKNVSGKFLRFVIKFSHLHMFFKC